MGSVPGSFHVLSQNDSNHGLSVFCFISQENWQQKDRAQGGNLSFHLLRGVRYISPVMKTEQDGGMGGG